MGVKKGVTILNAMIGNSSDSKKTTVEKTKDCDVLAIDASSKLYVAYEEVVGKQEENADRFVTNLDIAGIVAQIVEKFRKLITADVFEFSPKILVLTLDGVAPLMKILEQKRRRLSPNKNDAYNAAGELIFTMSWTSPGSFLLSELDASIRENSDFGPCWTIYSGPDSPGEGEHKIFPILQTLSRNGFKGMRDLRNLIILGNDNDLYFLGMLFLASFEKDVPELLIQNKSITERLRKDESTVATQFFDVGILLNSVLGGRFNVEGKNPLSRTATFVYCTFLLGNDFVPSMISETDDMSFESGTSVDNLKQLRTYVNAANVTNLSFDLENEPFLFKDKIFHVSINSDKLKVLRFFEEINKKIVNPGDVRQKLLKLASMNGRARESNSVAIAAACTYLKMMDSVLSYYVTSTCSVPETPTAQFGDTVPDWYYSYGYSLPSFSYLVAGAQILHARQIGTVSEYPKILTALMKDTFCNLDYSLEQPAPGEFVSKDFQSFIIFPLRTKSCEHYTQYYVPKIGKLCDTFDGAFSERDSTEINAIIYPYILHKTLKLVQFVCTDGHVDDPGNVLVANHFGERENRSNYREDALEP